MKYKVGDKVRIRSKEWYDKHKDERGEIVGAFFDKDRAKLCGTIQTIAMRDAFYENFKELIEQCKELL